MLLLAFGLISCGDDISLLYSSQMFFLKIILNARLTLAITKNYEFILTLQAHYIYIIPHILKVEIDNFPSPRVSKWYYRWRCGSTVQSNSNVRVLMGVNTQFY